MVVKSSVDQNVEHWPSIERTQDDSPTLAERYRRVRSASESLVAPLGPEDCTVQTMSDVSPTKWHLAHTTWFFETFVLAAASESYRPFDSKFTFLFNSYYNAVGEQFPRPHRGDLTRPKLDEVLRYRAHVDEAMAQWLNNADAAMIEKWSPVVTIGLNHEQQHQELILTDIKHVFACNPLYPVYAERPITPSAQEKASPLEWLRYEGGMHSIGYDGTGFCYDNEQPRHDHFQHPFELSSRLITNGEFLAFIEDGGYGRHELWLSDGWTTVRERSWLAPLYWQQIDGQWMIMTLAGLVPLDATEPVCHVSYFEADAFARWAGAELPTETAWEIAAKPLAMEGNFQELRRFHPAPADRQTNETQQPQQMFGDVWEWTRSPYVAYPGYAPPDGALGEYNGKFMCNQWVLRGGSCATPRSHIRRTYRNFFPADARWQFSGIRLMRTIT